MTVAIWLRVALPPFDPDQFQASMPLRLTQIKTALAAHPYLASHGNRHYGF